MENTIIEGSIDYVIWFENTDAYVVNRNCLIIPPYTGIRLEYATKDILYVMRLLGHKNIHNTLVYTQLVNFNDNEYISKSATTSDEADKLIEAGFEYVCTTPDGVMKFRKRK